MVSTPRVLPAAPSGKTIAGPRSRFSRAVFATRSSWRKSSTLTGCPVASTSPDSDAAGKHQPQCALRVLPRRRD